MRSSGTPRDSPPGWQEFASATPPRAGEAVARWGRARPDSAPRVRPLRGWLSTRPIPLRGDAVLLLQAPGTPGQECARSLVSFAAHWRGPSRPHSGAREAAAVCMLPEDDSPARRGRAGNAQEASGDPGRGRAHGARTHAGRSVSARLGGGRTRRRGSGASLSRGFALPRVSHPSGLSQATGGLWLPAPLGAPAPPQAPPPRTPASDSRALPQGRLGGQGLLRVGQGVRRVSAKGRWGHQAAAEGSVRAAHGSLDGGSGWAADASPPYGTCRGREPSMAVTMPV